MCKMDYHENSVHILDSSIDEFAWQSECSHEFYHYLMTGKIPLQADANDTAALTRPVMDLCTLKDGSIFAAISLGTSSGNVSLLSFRGPNLNEFIMECSFSAQVTALELKKHFDPEDDNCGIELLVGCVNGAVYGIEEYFQPQSYANPPLEKEHKSQNLYNSSKSYATLQSKESDGVGYSAEEWHGSLSSMTKEVPFGTLFYPVSRNGYKPVQSPCMSGVKPTMKLNNVQFGSEHMHGHATKWIVTKYVPSASRKGTDLDKKTLGSCLVNTAALLPSASTDDAKESTGVAAANGSAITQPILSTVRFFLKYFNDDSNATPSEATPDSTHPIHYAATKDIKPVDSSPHGEHALSNKSSMNGSANVNSLMHHVFVKVVDAPSELVLPNSYVSLPTSKLCHLIVDNDKAKRKPNTALDSVNSLKGSSVIYKLPEGAVSVIRFCPRLPNIFFVGKAGGVVLEFSKALGPANIEVLRSLDPFFACDTEEGLGSRNYNKATAHASPASFCYKPKRFSRISCLSGMLDMPEHEKNDGAVALTPKKHIASNTWHPFSCINGFPTLPKNKTKSTRTADTDLNYDLCMSATYEAANRNNTINGATSQALEEVDLATSLFSGGTLNSVYMDVMQQSISPNDAGSSAEFSSHSKEVGRWLEIPAVANGHGHRGHKEVVDGMIRVQPQTEEGVAVCGLRGNSFDNACLMNYKAGFKKRTLDRQFSFIPVTSGLFENPVGKWDITVNKVQTKRSLLPCLIDVQFSKDSQYWAAAMGEGKVKVFSYPEGKLICDISTFFGPALCIDWTPDSKILLIGGEDDCVTLVNIEERRLIGRCEGHNAWVRGLLVFNPGKTEKHNLFQEGSPFDGMGVSPPEFAKSKHHGGQMMNKDANIPLSHLGMSAVDYGTIRYPCSESYCFASVSEDGHFAYWEIPKIEVSEFIEGSSSKDNITLASDNKYHNCNGTCNCYACLLASSENSNAIDSNLETVLRTTECNDFLGEKEDTTPLNSSDTSFHTPLSSTNYFTNEEGSPTNGFSQIADRTTADNTESIRSFDHSASKRKSVVNIHKGTTVSETAPKNVESTESDVLFEILPQHYVNCAVFRPRLFKRLLNEPICLVRFLDMKKSVSSDIVTNNLLVDNTEPPALNGGVIVTLSHSKNVSIWRRLVAVDDILPMDNNHTGAENVKVYTETVATAA